MKNFCSSRIRHGNELAVNAWDYKEISNLDHRHASVCVAPSQNASRSHFLLVPKENARAPKPGEDSLFQALGLLGKSENAGRASEERTSGEEGEEGELSFLRSPSSPLVFSALARFFALSPQTESLEQAMGRRKRTAIMVPKIVLVKYETQTLACFA